MEERDNWWSKSDEERTKEGISGFEDKQSMWIPRHTILLSVS